MTWSNDAQRGLGLAELEDWLVTVMTTPGGLDHGLARALERHPAARLAPVRGDERASPRRRLAIHAAGYLARLIDCLRAEHPALCALVGQALFDRFATEYLWRHPPRGPSLFALGAHFAAHLESTRPDAPALSEARRALLHLPADLVRFERARLEAVRAPGWERDHAPDAAAAPMPALVLGAAPSIVEIAPCARVVACHHDVRAFVAAVDRGAVPSAPAPDACALAVSRVGYRVTVTRLESWQAHALAWCADSGPGSVVELATSLARGHASGPGARLADLALWLPTATQLGLLRVRPTAPDAPDTPAQP